MSGKSRYKKRTVSVTEAVRTALSMFLWAYCNVYDPDEADMENMSKEIQNVQESVTTGRLKIREIEQALEDEYGWKVIR